MPCSVCIVDLEIPDLFHHGFGTQIVVEKSKVVGVDAVGLHIFIAGKMDLESEVPGGRGGLVSWEAYLHPHHTGQRLQCLVGMGGDGATTAIVRPFIM